MPDGTTISGPITLTGQPHAQDSDSTTVTDRNGNTLSITGNCAVGSLCTETLADGQNRAATIQYSSNGTGSWTDTVTSPGPNGPVTANINWTAGTPDGLPYYCQTSSTGVRNNVGCNVDVTKPVVTSVQLPPVNGNSSNYLFGYNAASGAFSWGEVHSAELCSGPDPSGCTQQWQTQYTYQFDTASGLPSASNDRPPGTPVNPIRTKTLMYNETLSGALQSELTTYYIPVAANAYAYPVVSSLPSVSGSGVVYPDGTEMDIFTENLCPSNLKARDLCVALPYKISNRDNSITESMWVSNTAPPGVPGGALVNPYVQYSLNHLLNSTVSSVKYAYQDQNGNTTTVEDFDWVPPASIARDSGTGAPISVCSAGCTKLRETDTAYYGDGNGYWVAGSAQTKRSAQTITTASATSTFTYDSPLTTANVTQLDQYDDLLGANVTTRWGYLPGGKGVVNSVTDPNGNVTSVTSFGCSNGTLYPSAVTAGGGSAARRFSYTYDCASGVKTGETDVDNSVSTTLTYDDLGRVTKQEQTTNGFDRVTSISFDDVNRTTTTTQDDTATQKLVSSVQYDPIGREAVISDTAGNVVRKAWRSDPGNRLSYQLSSNPYTSTSDATMGWTLTTSDLIHSAATVQNYQGAAMPGVWGGGGATSSGTATAQGNQTIAGCSGPGSTRTDEAANTTSWCSDGAGRLVSLTEADGTVTSYSYDGLDDVTFASVGGQKREFEYSSLGRLKKACNPESATASCSSSPLAASGLDLYSYDSTGNLLTHTDARGTVTTLSGYDAQNRPASKSYSDGTPSVTYGYDTDFKGAWSSVSVSQGGLTYQTSYAHDALGRISGSTQKTGSDAPYVFTYQYALSDRLSQIQYPSGRTVKYLPDSAGRVQSVQNTASGLNYAQVSYTAAGDVSSMTMGNSVVESTTWNDRLQPVRIQAGSQLKLELFPCTGLVTSCPSGNNGNVRAQRITIPGLTATQTYTYDTVNRLLSASESGGSSAWSESYLYDDGNGHQTANRYVNPNPAVRTGLPSLTNETPTGPAWFGSNNQIASGGWVTDPAGNIQAVGGTARSFTWDAEDRQTSATVNGVTWTYVYDGLGQRVQKTGNGAATTFVYDAEGKLAAEYQPAGQTPAVCATATCYITVDHLGSTRMITDSSGNVAARYDYQPFGTELQAGTGGRLASMGYRVSPDGFLMKFTGQVRDQESGLDYMHARMYSPAEGRFTGVDPGNAGADMGNGQSWNGYAYVGNNPMSSTDPGGMVVVAGDGGGLSGIIAGGIVAGIEALGHGLEDLFGSGGSHVDLSNVAWTPMSTWSVTGWGMADTANSSGSGGVYNMPGVLFFAQATASLPRKGSGTATSTGAAPSNPRRVFLPPNALTCTGMGRQFYAPSGFNLSNVVAAGSAGGKLNIFAMNRAVGHFGTFGYQRAGTPSSFTFYKGLTPVSNIDVGAYLYGAGFTQSQAGTVSNTF